ncbi:MAG: 30S ribosomal protein S20 [Defluviitaleaceae bacterium]|nr:30S ribosomal protein S20 [Defluviitaleaceae bacterium]
MANKKSAKKRIKVTEKRTLRNKMVKSKMKTAIRKVNRATEISDMSAAKSALNHAISEIDRAATKGVLHKNNASRKKSRLTKMVNKIPA